MTPLHSLETNRARLLPASVMLAGAFIICLLSALEGFAQTPAPTPVSCPTPPPTAVGVIRVTVKYKDSQGKDQALQRKRFFIFNLNSLVAGVDLAKLIPEAINRDTAAGKAPLTRDAFYRSLNLNDQDGLIRWMRNKDCKPTSSMWCECDSVYCREITEADVSESNQTGVKAFYDAYQASLAAFKKERPGFGSAEIARQWLTSYLPENIRVGFANRKEEFLNEVFNSIFRPAERKPTACMQSVMTNSQGVAYFTGLEPAPVKDQFATYIISNIIPSEVGDKSMLWVCTIKTKALGEAKPVGLTTTSKPTETIECKMIEIKSQ